MAFETISLGTQPAGTGGDTARTAFEKVNRNFLAADVLAAAMSQAQFEAIRAQNNEEFAASGSVHKGKHYNNGTTYIAINDGLWTVTDAANTLALGKHETPPPAGSSKTNYAVLNLAGVIFNIAAIGTTGNQCNIKFPQAPDGKTTYNKSTGAITNHSTVTAAFNAQTADPTNVEVVTDRVDMWGFEAFLEEVSATNPYVYPNGLIQSQSATMDGIVTSASSRPVTYYAVFDGDTGSKGKGVNFFALNDANKKKVLANPKNNLYYLDDGRLVQWRLRQRTFAGAGNGDWIAIDSTVNTSYGILPTTAAGAQLYRAQGNGDVPYSATSYWCPAGRNGVKVNWGWPNHTDIAIYQASKGSNGSAVNSVNGECYFLVCGTVNRLNRGAYHPSFNPSGTNPWKMTNTTNHGKWYSSNSKSNDATGKQDAFDFTNFVGSFSYIGQTNTSLIGRDDGRLYDVIYADGQGGVCRDMRYSAYGVDAVDFAEADLRVKNGTYRGFEKLPFTKAGFNVASTPLFQSGRTLVYIPNALAFFGVVSIDAKNAYISNGTGRYLIDVHSTNATGDYVYINARYGNLTSLFTSGSPVVLERGIDFSVGGSFLQTDVIGSPENILATPQLANGWQGSWIPVIPNGVEKYRDFPFTRKSLQTTPLSSVSTDNNGSTFATGTPAVDSILNSPSSVTIFPASRIQLLPYQAFAKQTENAVNAEVYGGHAGVGRVYSCSYSATDVGALLGESLLNKILTSATNLPLIDDVSLTKTKIQPTKKLATSLSWGSTEHDAIFLNTPINGSPAFKALNYNVNLNQQAFIQYAYTELKHNGTNWGDDGKVTIVDNQSTKTDLNGNTVLVGTAKLKEPIGWIKNKV